MIVSANQPYFCPFPGFFYKALLSDILVILDDVQFPQSTTWISRNRFKNDQGPLWLTIPVWKKGWGRQNINQVRICYEGRWPHKHLESLKAAYGNAPYLADHLNFIKEIFSSGLEKLVDLNLTIISYLLSCLQIDTRLVLLSDLKVKAKGPQLLLESCKAMEASTFLVQRQAYKYLDPELFHRSGIELCCFRYRAPIYPQLWGDFLAHLSTFDLVFNCGPKARDIMIGHQPASTAE
ncbi:MAG: WbqC family protein [Desulfobacteraceae bacterium]